jgi:hypothetical protein
MQLLTARAPVHEHPFAVAANGDGDRFHERAALGGPVAWTIVVQMTAP